MHHSCSCTHQLLVFACTLTLLRVNCWKINWSLSCICSPSKIRLPRFLLCTLVFDSRPIWLSASSIAFSSWTAKWSMEGTAQRASMLLILFLMFVSALAGESWMVVHVTTRAIQSRVFGSSTIQIEDCLDPLHVELLVIFGQVPLLDKWTCWIRFFAWTQVGLLEVDLPQISPLQSLFIWVCTICWIGWNALVSLGNTSGSRPF